MKQFIKRNSNRPEHDDYILNVIPAEGRYNESLEVYENGQLSGWLTQSRYE